MGIVVRSYSVLVVSAVSSFNDALPDLLPTERFYPVTITGSISAAKRELAERSYDLVIVNSPLPDDVGIRFAIDAGGTSSSVPMIIVKGEHLPDIYERATAHGIFTLQKPISRSMFTVSLGWMCALRERLRKFEKKTQTIEEKMSEIRLVNRAKWLLMTELKMEEPDAHRYIEKQAMDRSITKKAVAEEIISLYS